LLAGGPATTRGAMGSALLRIAMGFAVPWGSPNARSGLSTGATSLMAVGREIVGGWSGATGSDDVVGADTCTGGCGGGVV
jgi:hypothetical protein